MLYKPMNYVHVTDQLVEILFKIKFMKISEIVSNFPEYAKDIKLNYTKILNEQILNQNQLYGII